jgi:hypothetical protein
MLTNKQVEPVGFSLLIFGNCKPIFRQVDFRWAIVCWQIEYMGWSFGKRNMLEDLYQKPMDWSFELFNFLSTILCTCT